jgi:serine/threonine protein kinase/tetratricopeptide (TPR) repeat protein
MIAQTLAHYRITAKLGHGGMGEVYRATDSKLGREIAIKVLPREVSRDRQALARFEREAKALATLNHPNIASIHGFDADRDTHFIVLELVEGETLAERLRRGRLPVEEALGVAKQIAQALEAAHAKGIVHRDLKPGNIKFTADGRVKVLDFGLAKLAAASESEDVTLKSEQTTPGAVLGTPAYMSPEQARGLEVDKRTDVWAFGCCLYECLAGLKPFRGDTISDLTSEVLRSEPDWSALPSETPREVTALLRRCLEKDPRRRLSSLGDIAISLEDSSIPTSASSFSGASSDAPRNPRRTAWLIAIAMTVLVALSLFWWSHRNVTSLQALRYQKSVAVLPLELKSPGLEAFADSLGEGIVNGLGALRKFDRVPPWEASSGIDRRRQEIRAVADRLEVSTLVVGSIRKEGDALRIAMSLVNPFQGKSGNVIWSESFKHDQGSELPFEIQDRITRSVVEGLQVQLDDQAQSKFVNRFTKSAEAYEYYTKGRYHWKRRGTDLEKAKHWFELALLYDSPTGVLDDSRMALAWSGLADTYNMQRFYGLVPGREGLAKGQACVAKALEIDPMLAEAHAALGWLRLIDCDSPGAASAFERAIQLNDRCVNAYYWYSSYFTAIGNSKRAAELARKAVEIDPVSDFTKAISAWQLTWADQTQDALKMFDAVLQNNPTYALAHYLKGQALLRLNKPALAVPSYESATKLSGEQPFFVAGLAKCTGHGGALGRGSPVD